MAKSILTGVLVTALVLSMALGAFAIETGKSAPDFSLKDQFGKAWSLDGMKGKVTVVIVANPKSGESMGPWVDNLNTTYGNKIEVLGMLDLQSVPGIGRGIAKIRIRRETKEPMMLDFSGDITKSYGVSDDYPVVVVIDKNSVAISIQKVKYSSKAFDSTSAAIDKALKQNAEKD